MALSTVRLVLSLIASAIICECTENHDHYQLEPSSGDLMCPSDQVEFETTAGSAMSCVRRCSGTPACLSLIFLSASRTCYVLRSVEPFNGVSSSSLPGAVFYKQVAAPGCAPSIALVSGPNGIADNKITASSEYADTDFQTNSARLDGPFSWAVAGGEFNQNSWIQFEFATSKTVISITTQGVSSIYDLDWVSSYWVLHSTTCAPDSFVTVKDAAGVTQTFPGNTNTVNDHVTNTFATPILARCVRVNARTWDGWIALRAELNGC